MILRFVAVLLTGTALSGCVNVLLPRYPARHVELRVTESPSEDVAVRLGKGGEIILADSNGIVELDLPEIPRRCDRYLFYPGIPWERYPVPDLFVLKGERVLRKISLVRVHEDAGSSAMPMALPTE